MIPQVQPFVPEYNFYSNVLQLKQGKYDAAREQLSTLYGSLLNAPLTRDDNAQTRDQFFKAIDQDIQRMSGVDLSLNQNFESAQGVFNQLLDNKYIVKDMVWTKNLYNQYQRADSFRNCTDPEKCGGGWWEGGERLLGYAANDFKNVSLEESMKMGNARFVPYQDITKRAIQLAKDADLNISIDQITGEWITTTKNGPAIVAPLQQLLMGSIAQDPKVTEFYQAQAEVSRRDFIYGNKEVYGSEAAAEQAYINSVMPQLNEWINGVPAATEGQIKGIDKKKEYLEQKAQNAPPYQKRKLEQIYQNFVNLQSGLQQTLDYTNNLAGENIVAQNNQRYTGAQVDNMLAGMLLGTDINKLATTLSYRNYEFKIKENPYAVQAAAFRNSMLLEELKFQHDLTKMQVQAELGLGGSGSSGGGKNKWGPFGDPASNTPTKTPVKGAYGFGGADEESEEYRERAHHGGFLKTREPLAADISGNERQILDMTLKTAQAEAEMGNQQAKEDYIAIVKQIASTEGTHEKRIVQEGEETLGDRSFVDAFANRFSKSKVQNVIKQLENASPDVQYEMAQAYMKSTALEKLGGTRVASIYHSVAADMLDPSKADAVMRDYLQPIVTNTFELREEIEAKNLALAQMDKWHADKIQQVADYAREQMSPLIADAIESYYDDEGYIVDKETFIQNMVNKDERYGYSDQYRYIEAMYEGKGISLERGEYLDEKEGRVKYSGWMKTGDYLADIGEDVASAIPWIFGQSDVIGDLNPEIQAPKSVSDAFQEAFTGAYLRFKGDPGWAGLVGAGDEAAYGLNYKNVDVTATRSVGTMGFLSYMADALSSGETRFDIGSFKEGLPENSDKARELMNIIFNDFKSMYKDENRPILDITYSDIAGADPNMVGLNIKLNQDYLNKYKGSKDSPGLMRDYLTTLQTEGITAYMPRTATQNLFTLGAQKSVLENLMDVTGEIKMDTYPDYFQNFSIKYNPSLGGYTASGMWRNGLDQNGEPNWDYHEANYTIGTDLNQLVRKYDQMLQETIRSNKAFDQVYAMNSKRNNQQYGG